MTTNVKFNANYFFRYNGYGHYKLISSPDGYWQLWEVRQM